jgi:hypothetical protein
MTARVNPPPRWMKRQPFGEKPIKGHVDLYKLAGIPRTIVRGVSDDCPPRHRVVAQEAEAAPLPKTSCKLWTSYSR